MIIKYKLTERENIYGIKSWMIACSCDEFYLDTDGIPYTAYETRGISDEGPWFNSWDKVQLILKWIARFRPEIEITGLPPKESETGTTFEAKPKEE